MRKDAQVVAGRGVARQLTIAIAGFGALGAVGFADATIGDDVDFARSISRSSPRSRGRRVSPWRT